MSESLYLVFGDLHGRILPAFRLARAFARDHRVRLAGLLQVGDLGYFPDPTRLDRATQRYAEDDELELGAALIARSSAAADAVFAADCVPEALWFTAGNHEDFEALEELSHGMFATGPDFAVDAYDRVRCIRDGQVATLPGGLRVGALWGIDDRAPRARRHTPKEATIRPRSATTLTGASFDVLLTHDSPRDAVIEGSGSESISSVVQLARPAFAFFGHYREPGPDLAGAFGETQVFHLRGLTFREGGHAEERSVGLLRWGEGSAAFEYVERAWLRTVTKDNWATR